MHRVPSLSNRSSRAGRLMAICVLSLTAGLALVGEGIAAGGSGTGDVISMYVDKAKVIRLPEKTVTVVVGNPNIADVTLRPGGVGILTGKSLGATNLIALDAEGTLITEAAINVQGAATAIVSVQRGAADRSSYACAPECLPTPQLGDNLQWFNDMSSQAERRRNTANSAAAGVDVVGGSPGAGAAAR